MPSVPESSTIVYRLINKGFLFFIYTDRKTDYVRIRVYIRGIQTYKALWECLTLRGSIILVMHCPLNRWIDCNQIIQFVGPTYGTWNELIKPTLM